MDNDFCLIQISYVTFVTVLSCLTTCFYPKLWIILKKGTKQYSILKIKCPGCQEGDFFKGYPYEFSTMGQVKVFCDSCTLKYSKEPGFYQGSYYVAYALGVALFVITWVSMYLMIPDVKPLTYIIDIVSLQLILTPLLYALSKNYMGKYVF